MHFLEKFIPTQYEQSIYEISYQTLKEQGITTLFFDLDNTIISYDEVVLNENSIGLLKRLSQEFKLVILSNSGKKRVSKALEATDFKYIYHATKPLKRGIKKALKISGSQKNEAILIGDQLMTDVFGANRTGIKVILIKSVLRTSDRKITQFNRKLEHYILKRVEKKYPMRYQERLNDYVNDHKM